MKALVLSNLSGPDALAIQDVAEPAAKAGQTVVRVSVGGLNFADIMTTRGGYPGTPPPPLVVGREFTGIEESSGRRVMGYAQWAAFAEKTSTFPHMIWPVPDRWTDEQAAAFPVNYFTAYLGYWQAGMTQPAAAGEKASCADSCGCWGRGHRRCADRPAVGRRHVWHIVFGRKTCTRERTWPAARHQLQAARL